MDIVGQLPLLAKPSSRNCSKFFIDVEPMAYGPNFMFPTTSENKDAYGFHSTRHLQAIIEAHAQWIKELLDLGWDGYLFTVMFHNLPGSRDAKVTQMKQEVEKLYGRLATRMVRKPRSPRWAGYLPVGTLYSRFASAQVSQRQKEHHCRCVHKRWPSHAWDCAGE